MRETMHDAPGVGLAAPQVGLSIQLVVIEDQLDLIQKLPPQQPERADSGKLPWIRRSK
jgi:peptide deformylase